MVQVTTIEYPATREIYPSIRMRVFDVDSLHITLPELHYRNILEVEGTFTLNPRIHPKILATDLEIFAQKL